MGKLLILLFVSSIAFANGVKPLTTSRIVYSSTNVTTGAWVEVIDALPQPVERIEIFDSSGKTMELGVGPVGGETRQILVFPGGNGSVPFDLAKGTRISVRAVSGTANSGELSLNFFQ
jgi:hypothetical protein